MKAEGGGEGSRRDEGWGRCWDGSLERNAGKALIKGEGGREGWLLV